MTHAQEVQDNVYEQKSKRGKKITWSGSIYLSPSYKRGLDEGLCQPILTIKAETQVTQTYPNNVDNNSNLPHAHQPE